MFDPTHASVALNAQARLHRPAAQQRAAAVALVGSQAQGIDKTRKRGQGEARGGSTKPTRRRGWVYAPA